MYILLPYMAGEGGGGPARENVRPVCFLNPALLSITPHSHHACSEAARGDGGSEELKI